MNGILSHPLLFGNEWDIFPLCPRRTGEAIDRKERAVAMRNRDSTCRQLEAKAQGVDVAAPVPAPGDTAGPARRTLVALALCALAACSGGGEADPEPTDAVALKSFSGPAACTELAAHVRGAAESMMREQFDAGAGVGEAVMGAPVPVAAPAPSAPGTAADGNAADAAGARFSGTTVRTDGVDEPDQVKNDGRRLFTLRSDAGRLVLSRVGLVPATAMTLQAQVAWPASAAGEAAAGLFLIDDARLVALSTGGGYGTPLPLPATAVDAAPVPAGVASTAATGTAPICVESGCGFVPASPPWVRLRLVDAGSDTLATGWTVEIAGRLIGARRIGDKLYVATQSDLRLPDGVRFYPDASSPAAESIDALKSSNARLIAAAPLSFWLSPLAAPASAAPGAATVPASEPTPAECASFARTGVATRPGWLRVSTIDLATRSVAHQTVLANASGLYVSARSVILTTPQWHRDAAGSPATIVHRFAFDARGVPNHDASGRFPGLLLDDYAIDERADGVIRVVAMQSDRSGSWTTLESLGRTPAQDGARLESLGRSAPIARGETLRAARFIGDRVYFVTFRNVDPFFVYDLADPARPLALGELKVPGFSTWLQPVGDTHLLGIGYDDGGWPRRIKASLFDVSDPGSPREQATLALGESFTDSDALWDPHAFTWLGAPDPADGGTMAIPVRSYAYPAYGTADESGIRIVDVSPRSASAPLALRGTLDMADLRGQSVPGVPAAEYGWRTTDPRRSVVIDDVVYGVADGAVRAARLDQPSIPLATVRLR
ncbi:MAG: beta-propeller domain-containing protein [Lautropia sp.]